MENIFRDLDRLDLPSDPVQEWFSNPAAEVRENAVRLCHGCKGNQANFLSEFQSICAQKAVYLVGQSFFGFDLKQDITVPGSTRPVSFAFVVIWKLRIAACFHLRMLKNLTRVVLVMTIL